MPINPETLSQLALDYASAMKGPSASIIKWMHGDAQALETKYDLLKDSLPIISTAVVAVPHIQSMKP
jgi:hypothetical protein